MNRDELIDAVEAALGSLTNVYRDGADESDLYEASLFTLAVVAARDSSGLVGITNTTGTSVAELHFRRSPGNLWAGAFTHAQVSFPGSVKELEIHLGVYVGGVSGVPHECDLALLDRREAERSRAGRVHPRWRGLISAVEAKHYHVSPGIGIGRGFLGLAAEIGRPKSTLTFPARSSPSLATLIARKPSECFDEVEPGTPASQRLCGRLEQQIRNWLA